MNAPLKQVRIGDFQWVTWPLGLNAVASIVSLGSIVWCCWQTLTDPQLVSGFVAGCVILFAIPMAVGTGLWAASSYVLWVEMGDDLTFATLLSTHRIPWSEVQGIEFETEYTTIPLTVLPFSLVVGQRCAAVITLKSTRELRGRISHNDAVVLHRLLADDPRLDTHFVRALSTPRAAVQTFVDAVMEDQLFYASKFLDMSKLESPATDGLAARCATRLKEVIDQLWFIDFEELPDDPDTPSPYILVAGTEQGVDEQLWPLLREIKLARDPSSGCWRFDGETVALIVNHFMNPGGADNARGR